MSKSNLIILIVSIWAILATSGALYLYFQEKPVHIDNSFLESKIKDLTDENNFLKEEIDLTEEDNIQFAHINDSLLSLKPKIEIKYVNIYKEIDNSSAIDIVELSDSIYTAEGIGR